MRACQSWAATPPGQTLRNMAYSVSPTRERQQIRPARTHDSQCVRRRRMVDDFPGRLHFSADLIATPRLCYGRCRWQALRCFMPHRRLRWRCCFHVGSGGGGRASSCKHRHAHGHAHHKHAPELCAHVRICRVWVPLLFPRWPRSSTGRLNGLRTWSRGLWICGLQTVSALRMCGI